MKEQKYQYKIKKDLEKEGFIVLNLINVCFTGIPDLLALKPDRVYFIECKKPKGIISPIQHYVMKKLVRLGFKVDVAFGYEIKPYNPCY